MLRRREFLKLSCCFGVGVALGPLGFDLSPAKAYAAKASKADRVKSAKQTLSICCYCSVGCGLICSTDTRSGQVINVEGDPENPINEGSLCAKGAGTYQTSAANEHRLKEVLYRAPYSDKWEKKSWKWAIDRIARLTKDQRDKTFIARNSKNELVNRCETIAHMGSSNVDSEECWSMTALARSLGLVFIDHQARV